MDAWRDLDPHEFRGVIEDSLVTSMPLSVSWLNHHSVQAALTNPALETVDLLGIDGKFLQLLLRFPHRTSADIVLPELLRDPPKPLRVALLGSTPENIPFAARTIQSHMGTRSEVVLYRDGYHGLLRGSALQEALQTHEVDLLILGLGAGLQETVAEEAKAGPHPVVAITCGGWLDQVVQKDYYPSWAYPLRLNWLVRLAKEPTRLWRRYTVDAWKAAVLRTAIHSRCNSLRGLTLSARIGP